MFSLWSLCIPLTTIVAPNELSEPNVTRQRGQRRQRRLRLRSSSAIFAAMNAATKKSYNGIGSILSFVFKKDARNAMTTNRIVTAYALSRVLALIARQMTGTAMALRFGEKHKHVGKKQRNVRIVNRNWHMGAFIAVYTLQTPSPNKSI